MSGRRDRKSVVIRREEVEESPSHGGAWKVAYADFVTAMMAFFLLMWLLNSTTVEQRRGLADYFSPDNPLSHGTSGTGLPFGGKTPFDNGDMVSDLGTMAITPGRTNEQTDPDADEDRSAPSHSAAAEDETTSKGPNSFDPSGRAEARPEQKATKLPGAGQSDMVARISPDARALALVGSKTQMAAALTARGAADAAAAKAAAARQEAASFDRAASQIRDAIRGDRLLAEMSHQIAIDQTPDGLRIQLLDEDHRPMFGSGASVMEDRARQLLLKMAPVLAGLTEPISISGHTDAAPFHGGDKTNWELSSDRANATRRLLVEAGVPESRFRSVTGNADRDPLLPDDPMAAANRRISILVLKGAVPAATPKAAPPKAAAP